MNISIRLSFGVLAGAIAGIFLAATGGHPRLSFGLGVAVGAAYGALTRPMRGTYADSIMAGGALGFPLWGLVSVIPQLLMSQHAPEWGAEQIRAQFPAMVGWVMYGATLGFLTQALSDGAQRLLGPTHKAEEAPQEAAKRILILGGGFAGMRTAECLEEQLQAASSVSITLVSNTNSLLFTPMLAEVAGSSLEPSHISTPLRSTLHRTEFIRAHVVQIDLGRQRVLLSYGPGDDTTGPPREIEYDQLVLSLGSVSNYLGIANLERSALNFKSLHDAIRIRNQVIEMFERADRERDPSYRRALLTFVVAGGGFAGVELAGALNDFAHGILADYPNLSQDDLSIVLVHAHNRILPELSESLAQYAQKEMEGRGVKFRLNSRLTDALPGLVILSDGSLRAETLVWTAGTAPNPLLSTLPLNRNKRGAVIVDDTLAVNGHEGVWAIGDCAAVNDAITGKTCPPTAQFALRQAETLAKNISAKLGYGRARSFHFDSLGALCVVGHQTACAEISLPFIRTRSARFSGLLAWFMWRSIYLSKLPGLERKIRVLVDWTIELFFPRDIVQTIDLR